MSLLTAVIQEANKAALDVLLKGYDELLPQIKELTEKVQLLTFSLQQYFIDLYVNFTTPAKSLEQLYYKNRSDNIISEYTTLREEVEKVKRYRGKNEELMTSSEKLGSAVMYMKELCVVVEGKRVLEKANHEFCRYDYPDAMRSISELQLQIKDMKFEGKVKEALTNLKSQAENQMALYNAQLSSEWEDIFKWTEQKSVYYITYSLSVQQSDPVTLQKVLQTLHSTDRMNAELGLFSHFFIDQLLHNIIRHTCEIFTEDHLGAIVFNIKINLNEAKKPNYQTIFNNLTAIFEFLESTLGSELVCDRKFLDVFGDSIRDKFFNKIIEDCIKNNLPYSNTTYENYKTVASELDSFNKFLVESKFVEAHKSPLNKYIDGTECILYDKKCNKLLSDVRDLLSQSILHETTQVGSSESDEEQSILVARDIEVLFNINKPIFFPKCTISQNVKTIMKMIVEHLEESKSFPDKYGAQLVMSIKDIAVMYQAVVPLKFSVSLETSPLDIAIFFNNCFYLSHGFMGPWRGILSPRIAYLLLSQLIDSIQDLRTLALQKMSIYLQNQKDIIIKATENKDDSLKESKPWTQETFDHFDSALNDATRLFKELQRLWTPVLPLHLYEKCVSSLMETLCECILMRLFSDSTIVSEELVYMLAVRLEELIGDIGSLFSETTQVDTMIKDWNKFIKLPQLLKAQLLELAELWKEDKELSQHYKCEEIRQIVKMRFPDDQYRLKILKEIQ